MLSSFSVSLSLDSTSHIYSQLANPENSNRLGIERMAVDKAMEMTPGVGGGADGDEHVIQSQ